MTTMSAIAFAQAARALQKACRARDLDVPSFRSPPHRPFVDRTIRRAQGRSVVAVRVKARPTTAVLADMVDGTMLANGLLDLPSPLRTALWTACTEAVGIS